MPLSDRRARILALIVDDFVGSAQPVGSQSLVERHQLGLSSATVRNEMAALETKAYQPPSPRPAHPSPRYATTLGLMPERK